MNLPKLYIAAREGLADEVRELLRLGADANERCDPLPEYGHLYRSVTALMAAAGSPRSNAETVRALLEGGADPFAVSAANVSALWYAAGDSTGRLDSYTEDEGDPFFYWNGGDADRLRLLLDTGLPVHESFANYTLLGEACGLGDPARVRLLIDYGASVWPLSERRPVSHERPTSEDKGDSEVEMGPDSPYYEPHRVPLFMAAKSGNFECVQLILDQGFPVDFASDGVNGLNFAKSYEIAEFFLREGVQNIARRFSWSFVTDSIDDALENHHLGAATAIIRAILDPDERLRSLDEKLARFSSGGSMNPAALKLLISEGATVNGLDQFEWSPLHHACWQGDDDQFHEAPVTEEVLRVLLDAGADPNLGNGKLCPLHLAVSMPWVSQTSVRVLLEYGALPDVTDAEGWTPLMRATERGDLECIRILLQAGADPRPALSVADMNLETWSVFADSGPELDLWFLGSMPLGEVTNSYSDALEKATKANQMIQEACALWESESN